MRGACLLILLLAPVAGAQEFVPEWRQGPATFQFQNETREVQAGARFATDGASWIYVALSAPPNASERAACAAGRSAPFVVVEAGESCLIAPHPGIECAAPPLTCLNATGIPSNRPASGGHYLRHANWTQFVPDWHEGPLNGTVHGAPIHLEHGEWIAQDDDTYEYAIQGAPPGENVTSCEPPPYDATWVAVGACGGWTLHPSSTCAGSRDFCGRVGFVLSGGPDCCVPVMPVTPSPCACATPAAPKLRAAPAATGVAFLAMLVAAVRKRR